MKVELMKRTHIDGDLELQAEYEGEIIRLNVWDSNYPVLTIQLSPEGMELYACAIERIRKQWESAVRKEQPKI